MFSRSACAGIMAAVLAGCAAPQRDQVRLGQVEESPRRALSAAELRHSFPNVLLYNQDGQPVHFYDDMVKGRSVLIYFMFTTCTNVCPRTTANLVKVQDLLGERFGRDISFIAITLSPQTDTPAVLKAYAQEYGAKPGWTFLTGDKKDIDAIRKRLGLVKRDPVADADVETHRGLAIFGNEATGNWSALPGTMDAEEIARTILRRTRPTPQRAADETGASSG